MNISYVGSLWTTFKIAIFAVNVKEYSTKCRIKIAYLNTNSAQKPISHEVSMTVPLPPEDGLTAFAKEVEDNSEDKSISATTNSTDFEYNPGESSNSVFFSQECLNHLLRDLAFSKQKAELLASR